MAVAPPSAEKPKTTLPNREQQGDERAPNGELGDADEGDTDDFGPS